MSVTAPGEVRFALAEAREIMAALTAALGGVRAAAGLYSPVGSLRRGRVDVGDLEIIAPMPGPAPRAAVFGEEAKAKYIAEHCGRGADKLYLAIEGKLSPEGGIFSGAGGGGGGGAIFKPVKGLRPGFKYCDIEVDLMALMPERYVVPRSIQFQIHRYWLGERGNRGWIQLMRTGPSSFGQWVLGRWKRAFGIGSGGDGPASAHGYLVDRGGVPVPVENEEDVFERIGCEFIPAHERDSFMEARG